MLICGIDWISSKIDFQVAQCEHLAMCDGTKHEFLVNLLNDANSMNTTDEYEHFDFVVSRTNNTH